MLVFLLCFLVSTCHICSLECRFFLALIVLISSFSFFSLVFSFSVFLFISSSSMLFDSFVLQILLNLLKTTSEAVSSFLIACFLVFNIINDTIFGLSRHLILLGRAHYSGIRLVFYTKCFFNRWQPVFCC